MMDILVRCLRFVNTNLLFVFTFSFESNDSASFREKSVISTLANVVTRMYFSTSLSYENTASSNELTVSSLYAKSF